MDLVLANQSTIVFANSRRLAERLTARLNEIYAERQLVAAGGGWDAHRRGRGTTGRLRPPAAASLRGAGVHRPRPRT